MATSPLRESAEIKRREKKDEDRSGSGVTVGTGNAGEERCTCCPFGYHIDLDFLNFCNNLTNGSTLANLKRIQRTKRKLRKSMELMLQREQGEEDGSGGERDSSSSLPSAPVLPPDVVHSTESSRLMHMVTYEQSATCEVLRDIDSAVSATLASINNFPSSRSSSKSYTSQHRYRSTDSEDSFCYSPATPATASSSYMTFPFDSSHSQIPVPPPRQSSLRFAHSTEAFLDDTDICRKDSMSSVSSVSTASSEQVSAGVWSTSHGIHSVESPSASILVRQQGSGGHPPMTSESLAATMALHFPEHESEADGSPMLPDTTISKASLAAVKEAIVLSLQRLRDMEEKVRAIPILQVRISVLKEEKRLLALQMKAKSGNGISTRCVAVGGDSPLGKDSLPSPATIPEKGSFSFPSTSVPLKTPPPTLPKPSRIKVDASFGDHSVLEPYLLQPDLPTGYTIADHQVRNEIRSKVEEKKSMSVQAIHSVPQTASKPDTRSIGVGDCDLNAQMLQIHNTEIRTVIFGASSNAISKRSVGVDFKVPSRSVGVSFCPKDTAPSTRTIGVNVNNTNLASQESKGESELSAAVQALQQKVRTVGTHCNFQPIIMEAGVQHKLATLVSVECGGENDTAEISLPQSVQQCSMGTVAKPDMCDASVSPQKDWLRDGQTDTLTVEMFDKSFSTEKNPTGTVSTSTDIITSAESASQTEVSVFEEMEAIRSTGSNTASISITSSSSNTPTIQTADTSTNTTVTDDYSSEETAASVKPADKEYCDAGVNTTPSKPRLSMTKVECVDISGVEAVAASSPKRALTMQEHILQRGADQAFAFLGSTSSSGSLSPGSPKMLTHKIEQTGGVSTGAGASADDSYFASDTAVVKESFDVREGVCLQALSKQDLGHVEGHGLEEEKEQDESLTLLEDPSEETLVESCKGFTETITKLLSKRTRDRNSDGMKVSQEPNTPGIFSGQRVGSVEDFMPDEMRRLMNLDTVSPETKPHTQSTSFSNIGHSLKTFSKTTVTTTHTSLESGSSQAYSRTKTASTAASRSEVTHEDDSDDQFGSHKPSLSARQMDLSQTADAESSGSALQDDKAEEESSDSECSDGGIKDSGYYDYGTAQVGSEASIPQGADFSPMGSLDRKELKSIMKTSSSDASKSKKGISFAESVVGGTGSSSEEEGTDSDEDSTTSYDEGSYDGREGDITYECQDDEAIAQGLPGAKMYDQNIRETYELSEEMTTACQVVAKFLVDSTTIQSKELNASMSVVQEDWFHVSSHKLSSAHQVEDYLSSINEISHRLLEYIVNLIDANGNAAIHYCVSHCNFEIVGLLLDTEVCDVKKPNKAGYTPIMLASLAFIQNDEHREIIRQLCAAGDINAQAQKNGQTALMLATSQGRTDMVELLLKAGANVNQQDFEGSTALMVACEHGHEAIVHLLLSQPSCDPTLKDNDDSTALSIAMEAGHKDIGVILYKRLNFHGPGAQKKRKGSSSPTPSI